MTRIDCMKEYELKDLGKDGLEWNNAKSIAIEKANFIEFNILYISSELEEFIKKYEDDFVERGKKTKLYKSGEFLRFRFSNVLKEFISNSTFKQFKNCYVEDPSFYIGDNEIIATITHEDQIYYNKEHSSD